MKNKIIKIFGIGAVVLFALMALVPVCSAGSELTNWEIFHGSKASQATQVGKVVGKIALKAHAAHMAAEVGWYLGENVIDPGDVVGNTIAEWLTDNIAYPIVNRLY